MGYGWMDFGRAQKKKFATDGWMMDFGRAQKKSLPHHPANGDDGPCIATKTWFQFSRSDGLWIQGLHKKKRCVFLRGADGWMDFGRAQKNMMRSADFFFAGPLAASGTHQ